MIMTTIRVKLKEPIQLTNVRALTTEIYETIKKREDLELRPVTPAFLLSTIRWRGPLEDFGNSVKLVEVYELYKDLHTFYGSTIPLEVGKVMSQWEDHMKKKGIEETRAYFIEQVGSFATISDFWRKIGRKWDLQTSRRQTEYGATPIGEPFDWIIYPHPEEVNCSSYYTKKFLEYCLEQKDNIKKHLEDVLGRKIEIKESFAKFLLKQIKEDEKISD